MSDKQSPKGDCQRNRGGSQRIYIVIGDVLALNGTQEAVSPSLHHHRIGLK